MDLVVAVGTADDIVSADDVVLAVVAEDRIVALLAEDEIVAGAAVDFVVVAAIRRARIDRESPLVGGIGDVVAAVVAEQVVVAAFAEDLVLAGAAEDEVGTVAGMDRCRRHPSSDRSTSPSRGRGRH